MDALEAELFSCMCPDGTHSSSGCPDPPDTTESHA